MDLNTLSQLIYNELIHCSINRNTGFDQNYFNILAELRNTIIKNGDPLICMEIGNTNLLMNLSHHLPYSVAHEPLYDTALPRIAKTIFHQDRYLKVIDIGANIGDTAARISQEVPGSFLCVEGDVHYFSLLQENAKSMNAQVVCVNAICGESDCQVQGHMLTEVGTGHFVATADKGTVLVTSLNTILEKNAYFKDANLLKIDTDGFDSYVLLGARNFIANAGPTVFFEFAPTLLHNPLEVFPYLSDLGYRYGIFYTNIGIPLEVVDICNQQKLEEIVDRIGTENIGYYDVLLPGRNLSCESFIAFYLSELDAVQKISTCSQHNI